MRGVRSKKRLSLNTESTRDVCWELTETFLNYSGKFKKKKKLQELKMKPALKDERKTNNIFSNIYIFKAFKFIKKKKRKAKKNVYACFVQ